MSTRPAPVRLPVLAACILASTLLPLAAHVQAAQAAAAAPPAPSPAEQRYINTRDGYIRKFARLKELDAADDRAALAVLQQQLEPIVGPVQVQGFVPPAKISLQTLQQDGDFDMVDGMRLGDAAQERWLVASTPALLADYRTRHPGMPAGLAALWGNKRFATHAIEWGAAVTRVAYLPMTPAPGQRLVRAYLAIVAQDIGPFVPNQLYVFAATDRQVLMTAEPLQQALGQVGACEQAWKGFEHKDEDKGFAAYAARYGRAFPQQPGFAAAQAQAQALLDRLR